MIYTKDWAFIHIPKTSGINLKQRTIEHYKNIDYVQHNDKITTETMHNPYLYWSDIIKGLWIFSIVRNPFSRAVSLWKYCNEQRPAFQENFGYHDFYKFYTSKELKQWKGKTWGVQTPQFYFLAGHTNNIAVNVYKMETDLQLLELKLNFEFTKSKHNTMLPYNYKEIYDDKKNIMVIQEIFEIDFKTFNYNIDII